MQVTVGKDHRETHRRNEAGLLAEVNAHGVAEDPRSQREALPIPRPHPFCPVELHQLAGERFDPAALSHQKRGQLFCSLWLVGNRRSQPSSPSRFERLGLWQLLSPSAHPQTPSATESSWTLTGGLESAIVLDHRSITAEPNFSSGAAGGSNSLGERRDLIPYLRTYNLLAMETSLFAFATDLHDEGIDTVLGNLQDRAGVDGLTMAVAYHDARDLFPHNPVHKVRYLEGGAVFFSPDEARYEGLQLQPRVAELARTGDPLGDLCAAGSDRGMSVNAWAVFLHNDRLGFAHPECATQNAFGDRYLTDLCPSNPEVRAYARTLASDIARYEISTILAESLHFHGLAHGYHHERYFEELGAVGIYLLGLCFCAHCLESARRTGVDAEMVHRSVQDELGRRFAGDGSSEDSGELTRDRLAAFGGEQLLGYLDARTQTVASLTAEVSAAAAYEGANFAFLDLSGAEKGFATGHPTGDAAPAIGWQMGIDVTALAEACNTVEATGYAVDPDRLDLDLDAYHALVADASRLGLVLRPMPPDCRSADNLAAKVALARERGLKRVDFYHYGFCRLRSLDWIRQSLAAC